MGAKVVDFPISDNLRPEQVVGALAKQEWESLIGVGITVDGDFEVLNYVLMPNRAIGAHSPGKP